MSSMVLLKMDCTSGMQPPQPVPAFVQDFTCAIVEQVPFLMFSTRSPLEVLWQEQICVSSSLIKSVTKTNVILGTQTYRSSAFSSPSFWAPRMN
jgi:hypothetical protein